MKKTKLFLLLFAFSFLINAATTDLLSMISQDSDIPKEALIKCWAQLDKIDECISIIKSASIENQKPLIFSLLNNVPINKSIDLDPVVKIIASLPDPAERVSLYWLLMGKMNLDDPAVNKMNLLVEKYGNTLKQINKHEDEYLRALIDFSSLISKHSEFHKEYLQSLHDVETCIQSISDINRKAEILEYFLYSSIESDSPGNYLRQLNELKNIIPKGRGMASVDSLVEAAIGIEDFELLKTTLGQFADTSGARFALNSQGDLFLDLFLKKHGEEYFDDINALSEKKRYVSLLIWNLNLEEAKRFVLADKNWVTGNDWYLYCLGKLLIKRSITRIGLLSAMNITDKIKDEQLEAEIKIEAAQKLLIRFNDQLGYAILKKVSEDSLNKFVSIYNETKSFAEIWMEAGYFDEAMKCINKIGNAFERESQYLLIGERYLLHGNLMKAQNIMPFLETDRAKGILTAAIGAIKICQGNNQQGEEWFVRAFLLMKKESKESKLSLFSWESAISILLEYYVNAKRQGVFLPTINSN